MIQIPARALTALALAALTAACSGEKPDTTGRAGPDPGLFADGATDADGTPRRTPEPLSPADTHPTASAPGDPPPAPSRPPPGGYGDARDYAPEPVTGSAWTTGLAAREGTAGVATLTAVRSGRQEGYDRMVFEFGPGAHPGYHVSYIDKPVRQCGSGTVVPLPGDGWIEIRMEPAAAHTEQGQPTIEDRSRVLDLPNLRQVALTCDFEAVVTWVGGVISPNDFRVLRLTNPTRLVVDVRHR